MPRSLDLIPLVDLVGAPTNPKRHDEETLAASIQRFGYVEPIVRDDRTGRLVSGHGRTDALRRQEEAGEAPPEGIEVSEDGRWLVPILTGWASKNDEDAEAAVIALNRIGERGGWDSAELAAILAELSESTSGLVGVGYDADDLAAMLADLAEPTFAPDDGVDQPRLDQRTPVECPNCGHSFVPGVPS